MLDWIVPGSVMEATLLTVAVFGGLAFLIVSPAFVLSGGLSQFIADWQHSSLVARVEFEAKQKLAKQQEARMAIKQFRQGDVWIREITDKGKMIGDKIKGLASTIKPIARDKGRVVLAYGEVTGHSHAIADKTTEFFQCDDGRKILLVKDPETKLSHEEHGTITIPKGEYEIVQQREYDPELHSRPVLD